MKKIIFITPQFKTGGGNRVFIEIANVIASTYDVVILYPNNSQAQNSFSLNDKIIVNKVGNRASSNFAKLINVFKLFFYVNKHYKNEVVVISDPIISIFSFLLSAKNVIRFVQADDVNIYNGGEVIRSKFLLKVYQSLTKLMFRLPFTYIFNSQFTYRQYKKYGRKDVNPQIVHPAIDQSVFVPKAKATKQGINLCTIGRVHPIKGFAVFLSALQRLPTHYQNMINSIIVVSGDDLGRFNVQANAKIKIVSPQSDQELAAIYSKADIFISSSFSEGFGLPPLEAMACGCAVVVSNAGGMSEYAVANFNCLLFEPGDDKALSEKIIKLLNEPLLLKTLIKNGINTAQNSSWEKSASDFVEILKLK